MLLDCPYWVKHGEDGINGLDISPNGRRLATCGRNIIIWNMLPILDSKAEQDPDVPKVLAIMQEQEKGVLAVSFSNSGKFLAAGSSYPDNSVLIFKQVASPATMNMSIKFTGKENWRPTAPALKHHINDVTSLSWSPGDEYLASGSMDGNVLIWKVNQDGRCQLHHSIEREHNGWVKGLAFDPIGRYLATQGRNGVKVWDMQRGWALVSHMQKPFEGAVEQGLRYRTSWSPDGEVLIAANGFEQQQRTVCTFQRQSWEQHEMVGHQGAVLVAAANPRLFYPPVQLHENRRRESGAEEQQGGSGGVSAAAGRDGSSGPLQFGDYHSSVFVAGSTDKTFTIWSTDLAKAVLRVTQVHSGAFVDMAWTPDGYTLIAAAGDDKVSVMRFGLSELGKALTEAEFQKVLQSEYNPAAATAAGGGQAYGAAENGLEMQEDAELAALAMQDDIAVAMNGAFPTPPRPARPVSNAAAAAGLAASLQLPASANGPAAAAAAGVLPAPIRQAAPAAAGPGGGMSGGGALERRLMPQGAGATTGTLAQPRQQQQSAGQKRLHPTSTNGPAAAAAAAGGAGVVGHPAKRPTSGQQQQQGVMRAAGGAGRGGGWVLPPPGVPARLESTMAVVTERQQQGVQQYQSLTLLVENQRRGGSGAAGRGGVADVSLHLGGLPGVTVWTDKVSEQIVAIAGSIYFSAAATASGLLYTWRSGGNPLLPPLALGSPPVSMSAEGLWELLIVGADGSMLTLDLDKKQRQFCGPVPAPNLSAVLAASAPNTGLQEAWLTCGSSFTHSGSSSSSSTPVPIGRTQAAKLTDNSAWLFHPQLGLWLMLAPPTGLAGASAQLAANSLPTPAGVTTHPDVGRLRAGPVAVANTQQVQHGVEAVWLRQEAACRLTAAELLGDDMSYQRWLKHLVLLLSVQKDTVRLQELCQDLLGPERWDPSMVCHAWSPRVLGLEKRTLLAHIVIPTMAQERLGMATQVNACLKTAQELARQGAGRLVAGGSWRVQPAASAASPAAAAAGHQQQQQQTGTPGVQVHSHPWQQQQAGASGGPLQQQQQHMQQNGLQAAAVANGTPQGPAVIAPRRLQAIPVGPLPPQQLPQGQQQQQDQPPQQQQGQQQQHAEALQPPPQQQQQVGSGASVGPTNGVETAVRIPLQEQQQPHALTQQATPSKQQQPLQPAEKPAAPGHVLEPGVQNT